MKVLVAWADPQSPNMGVRVLAEGLREGLPREWQLDYVSHRSPQSTGPLLARRSLAAVLLPTPGRQELARYDLMIDVGEGDSFASVYGLRRLLRIASFKWAARRAGVPVVLAPQTLGPWRGTLSRIVARESLGAVACVWARDSASAARGAAIASTEVHLANDLVFCLKPPSVVTGPASERPVGLNVSGLLWGPNRHVPHQLYQQLINALLEEWQRTETPVRLIAHVVAPGQKDDDVRCSELLAERFDNVSVEVPAVLDDARRAIASCRYLIGARMHACLNALSVGVPTVPLAYSDKFSALFRDLGYPPGIDLRRLPSDAVDAATVLSAIPATEATEAARDEGVRRARHFVQAVAGHRA